MKREISEAAPGLAALVRRHDRDRYLTALFAPARHREALFALYAFNWEIARVRESVTQPMLGQIRLQWWREVIDAAYAGGELRHHEVAERLTAVIRRYALPREPFDRLIDAREFDLGDEPPATLVALEEYAEGTSSNLIRLALAILDQTQSRYGHGGAETAALHIGIGYGLTGLLRAMAFHASSGRCYIPVEIAEKAGLDPRDYAEFRATTALRQALETIGDAAESHLATARQQSPVSRGILPALLPANISGRRLACFRQAGWNPFDPRLAVPDPMLTWRLAAAMLRGRL